CGDAVTEIAVSTDSLGSLNSDYNLFHHGADTKAYTALVNGVGRKDLADWKASTSGKQDAHGVQGDPTFVDIDGADNVLGFASAKGGYDGGRDDNFYRVK